MKRIYLLAITLLLNSTIALSQPLVWGWVQGLGGKNNSDGYIGLTRDAQGNTYMVGDFSGSRSFGSFTLTATGFNEIFVAKYNTSGVCQWAVKAGSNFSTAYAGGIVMSNNELFVTGKFSNIINCQGVMQSSYGQSDGFIMKTDPATGTCLWIEKAGGTGEDVAIGIDAAPGGGFYICGSFTGTGTFGTQTISSSNASNQDIFLAKYTGSGSCSWVIKAGGTQADFAAALKADISGSVFITGAFQGTATFGTSSNVTSTNTNNEFYIAKYDASGNFQWVQKGGGKGNDNGRGLGVDELGNAYVTGFISDTSNFGGIIIYDNNAGNIFLAKYSPTGTILWAKDEGGALFDIPASLSTDHLGGTYVTGYITGTANFTGNILAGSSDVFIAKYDFAGTIRWATKLGGSGGYETGSGIQADSNGFCTLAGNYFGTITIGTTTLNINPGDFGTFLARLGGGTVGMSEYDNSFFSAYPNPAKDILYLNLQKITDDRFSVDILTLEGKLIATQLVSQSQATSDFPLNISEIANGNYLVRISSSIGDFTKPFVVNR